MCVAINSFEVTGCVVLTCATVLGCAGGLDKLSSSTLRSYPAVNSAKLVYSNRSFIRIQTLIVCKVFEHMFCACHYLKMVYGLTYFNLYVVL